MENKNISKGNNAAGIGLFLAVGVIIGAWILGWHFTEAKRIDNAHRNSIEVKGYAQKDIESDLGQWMSLLKSKSNDLTSAYTIINDYKAKTVKYLRDNGIAEKDIKLGAVYTREIFQQKDNGYGETNHLEGYELTMNISFQSKNLDKVEEISQKATDLIQQGVNISSFEPQFFYTKIEDLKLEMLGEASKNAYERAEKLAGNTDSEVGTLQSASQGVFQITSRNSTEVSDYGSFDTQSRLKTIKAVITASFSVK
ncbi:MAG: SIMPL domain-containing protein [Ignavibacteriae bacterium HGW-Ignavibacteriae-4]|jgi:hypothetical protein|nr:MAG: SIMPL domain-containing protein [Ignavibacteriae bacterium HGW-Ignavibacteriae-4]